MNLKWLLLAVLALGCGPDHARAFGETGLLPVTVGKETSEPVTFDSREAFPAGTATGVTRDVAALLKSLEATSTSWRSDFSLGGALFEVIWEVAPSARVQRDGLGPLFNETSCRGCHLSNGRGRTDNSGLLLRVSTNGNAVEGLGTQLQPSSTPGVPHEGELRLAQGIDHGLSFPVALIDPPLPEGTEVSLRMSPGLQGLGLLEAVSEATVVEWADPYDFDGDGITGRAARLDDGTLGRFGWKAIHATVATQAAGALHEDMGLTTSRHPQQTCMPSQLECLNAPGGGEPEVADAVLAPLVLHTRMLGVPARVDADAADVMAGKQVFFDLGCPQCHRPSMNTDADAKPSELAGQTIWPYTDLLLHDLGDRLSDDRPEGAASRREWRTPPLWALGVNTRTSGEGIRLLHDGRAQSVDEAVRWHGGEAQRAADSYSLLTETQRDDLRRFVESL